MLLALARRAYRRIGLPLLDALLPSDCFVCARALGRHQTLGACPTCWASFALLTPPLCPGCGLPRPPGTDLLGPYAGRCARCALEQDGGRRVRAVVAYDAVARRFLLRAKLRRRPEFFLPLGRRLARCLELDGFARGCTLVAAVPSHPLAILRRGFSPAWQLAKPVARALGLPLGRGILRRRLRAVGSIKRLGARQRERALADAVVAHGRLSGESVLLVDDVLTTGATVAACARALSGVGAAEVRVAVWARTLPPEW